MDLKDDRAKMALDYHAFPTPGKISVVPTKPLANQDDLTLAYSPGVATASMTRSSFAISMRPRRRS